MKIEIKKGDKFLCISNKTDAKKGKIYPAFSKEYIDIEGFGYNLHAIDPDVFQPLSSAKWAIKRTPENAEVVNRWANETFEHDEQEFYASKYDYIHSTGIIQVKILDGYTEIDFETFKDITGMGEEKSKQLLGEKEAVHCPTLELAEKVLEILKDNGAKPMSTVDGYWDSYKSNVCFIFSNNDFGFSDFMFYQSRGYTIIPAEQFIKDNEQKQSGKEVPKFQKGDTVVIRKCSKETLWYSDRIGEIFVLGEQMGSGNWRIENSSHLTIKPCDISKIFTIEDVRNGKCAIENDGTRAQLEKAMNYVLPYEPLPIGAIEENYKLFFVHKNSKIWDANDETGLPTQSVKLFLSQIEGEKRETLKMEFNTGHIDVTLQAVQTTEEWQPKWGEEVEARFSIGSAWIRCKYCCPSTMNESEFICEIDGGSISRAIEIRKPLEIHTFTTEQAKQDLAKLHSLNVNQIKIVE